MQNTEQARIAGILYGIGGGLWTWLTLALLFFVGGEPSGDSSAFVLSELLYILIQLLLLFGFLGLWWSHGVGQGQFGKFAFGLALLGHLAFVLAELHSLMIREASLLLPLAALMSAVGLLLTGIAVLRAQVWRGWARWIPLLTGLYPFLVMFPLVALTGGEANNYAVAGWEVFRLVLGLAIHDQAKDQATRTTAVTETVLTEQFTR